MEEQQPIQPQQPTTLPAFRRSPRKKLILALITLFLVGGTGSILAWKTTYLDNYLPASVKEFFGRGEERGEPAGEEEREEKPEEEPEEKPEEEPKPPDTTDWITRTNDYCKLSLKHPAKVDEIEVQYRRKFEMEREQLTVDIDETPYPIDTQIGEFLNISCKKLNKSMTALEYAAERFEETKNAWPEFPEEHEKTKISSSTIFGLLSAKIDDLLAPIDFGRIDLEVFVREGMAYEVWIQTVEEYSELFNQILGTVKFIP